MQQQMVITREGFDQHHVSSQTWIDSEKLGKCFRDLLKDPDFDDDDDAQILCERSRDAYAPKVVMVIDKSIKDLHEIAQS